MLVCHGRQETLSALAALLLTRQRENIMNHRAQIRVTIAAACLAVMLAGCNASNVQIARIPFISPIVVPVVNPPQQFQMNVGVQNYGKANSPDLWLKIYTEYWSTAQHGALQPPCSNTDWVHVGVLAPNQGWGLSDYRIDRGNQSCPCIKNSCPGHVWLDLHVAQGYEPHIKGPNTALHVNWVPSGDLAQMTIKEF